MCIKIIGTNFKEEFNPSIAFCVQMIDVKKVLINYDPSEKEKISYFVEGMKSLIHSGNDFDADIEINPNNNLQGIVLERTIKEIKRKIDINKVFKGLATFHKNTENKLQELSNWCMEKVNE